MIKVPHQHAHGLPGRRKHLRIGRIDSDQNPESIWQRSFASHKSWKPFAETRHRNYNQVHCWGRPSHRESGPGHDAHRLSPGTQPDRRIGRTEKSGLERFRNLQ